MSPPVSDNAVERSSLLALAVPPSVGIAEVDAEVLALFDEFRDPLLRYVCTFGTTVSEAEDVVQDVFVALFRHLRNGGARTNLRGWLFRVAHNLALKRRGQRQREQRFRAADDAADFVADPGADPEGQLRLRERRRRVAAILNALPERDRHCVYLRGSGLRYREIAKVLGISLGSVAKSMTRALARLQRATGS